MADLKLKVLMEAMDRISAPFKNAQKSTAALSKSFKEATDKLRGLEKSSANIEAFKRLQGQARANATALAAAQEKAQGLGRELAASDHATKKQERAFAKARAEVTRLKQAQIETARETKILGDRLGAAGIDTNRLSIAQRRLKFDTDAARLAFDRESKAMELARGKMNALAAARARMDKTMAMQSRLAVGGATAMAVGGAGLAMGVPVLDAGGDFEHKLAAYGLVAGQADGKLAAVRDRLREIAPAVNQASMDLLEGQSILVGKGMNPDAALASIGDIGRASTATGASITDMSNLAFSAMDNLKIAQADIARTFDIMARAGDEGGFELKNMATYFPQLTSAAYNLGLVGPKSVGSLAAALQVAMKGASDPSEAANNMANFLKAFTGKEVVQHFEQKGIDIKAALKRGVEAGEDPLETMMKLVGRGAGVDLEKEISAAVANGLDPKAAAERVSSRFNLSELFGDAQAQNFLAPMLANMAEYRRIRDAALSSEGNIDRKFAVMMATNVEAKKGLGIAIANMAEGIGNLMLPVMTPIINGLASIVRGIGSFAAANPNLTRTLIIVGGALAGMVFIGGTLSVAIAGLLGPFAMARFALAAIGIQGGVAAGAMAVLKLAFGGIAAAASSLFPLLLTGIRAVGLAFMANPIGLAITAIIAGLTALYMAWEPFRILVDDVFGKVKAIFGFGGDGPQISQASQQPRPALKIASAATAATIAASPAVAAAPAHQAPQAAGSASYTINVYTQPGQNETEIARMVRAEFEKMERSRKASARGNLYDEER